MRWLGFGGFGVGVGVLGLRIIGGAMKEGKGGNVAIYREDFSEESGGVDEAGEEDKAEKMLAHLSFNQSRRMSIDLDFFGRTEEVARPIAHSLSTKRRGGGCWGWPRLVSVSVSSANTCPPHSASATDATTTGMRWQKA